MAIHGSRRQIGLPIRHKLRQLSRCRLERERRLDIPTFAWAKHGASCWCECSEMRAAEKCECGRLVSPTTHSKIWATTKICKTWRPQITAYKQSGGKSVQYGKLEDLMVACFSDGRLIVGYAPEDVTGRYTNRQQRKCKWRMGLCFVLETSKGWYWFVACMDTIIQKTLQKLYDPGCARGIEFVGFGGERH